MADAAASLSTLSGLFKILYGKKSYAVFNTATPLLSRVKRIYDFKGLSMSLDAVLGFSGSVGSGSLPETSVFQQENATMSRKKLYARILLDREAMIASKGEQGAFEDATKRVVRKGVESFTRNLSRQLFAFENGKVFEGNNSTVVTGAGSSGAPYVVRALSTTFVKGFLEKKDKVYINGEGLLDISNVDYSTGDVSLVGTSATLAAVSSTGGSSSATSAKFYMQGSKDNDMESILAVCKATSSTKYNISIGPRWQSAQVNASSAGISVDLINQLVSEQEFQAESPDLIVTSFKQQRKLKNLLGDKLRYCTVSPRDPIFKKAGISFQGIEIQTDSGPVPLVADRMCPDDHLFSLNTDYIELHMAEPPKWADEDGTVLLRSSSADAYEARYVGYGNLFVHPHAQGVLYSLA